jgi:outer membrane protein assembly factor BamB
VDVKNGNLLWSKWLGPMINSTPTVSKGVVYTCYPRNTSYEYKTKDSAFVLIAFNLKSGSIAWQKWIDGEIVGAPVVANNSVYVTTNNESLFQFDKTNGKQIASLNGGIVSAPTVVNDVLYAFKRAKAKDENCQLLALSATTLQNIAEVGEVKTNISPYGMVSDSFNQMNFNRNRVVHSKGKNYCISNGTLFCFNKSDQKIAWQKKIYDPAKIEAKYDNSLPVVSGGQVVIASPLGQLLFFDANSGNKIQEYKFTGDQLTDAIAQDGWVYCGTTQGKVISVNTKNKLLTGWGTWSGNMQHNPVVN